MAAITKAGWNLLLLLPRLDSMVGTSQTVYRVEEKYDTHFVCAAILILCSACSDSIGKNGIYFPYVSSTVLVSSL